MHPVQNHSRYKSKYADLPIFIMMDNARYRHCTVVKKPPGHWNNLVVLASILSKPECHRYVFQQILQNETLSMYYHTFDRSRYELGFLAQNENDEIIPIEAKAGENLKSNSFRLFCQKNNPQTAIRISLLGYKKEPWMTNISLYGINAIK